MSKLIELDLRPSAATLRQFGVIALFGFSLIGLLAWTESLVFAMGLGAARVGVAGGFFALAAVAALFALVWPAGNRPIYLAMIVISFPIGFVMSYVIMATLFYGIIAPIGMLLRVFGNDPMQRGFSRSSTTYWLDARPTPAKAHYFRQF